MDYKRILTLHYTCGMSGLEIAHTTGDGKTTVNEFLKRFRECGELSYPLPEDVTNEFIADRLYHADGHAGQLLGSGNREQRLGESFAEQRFSGMGSQERELELMLGRETEKRVEILLKQNLPCIGNTVSCTQKKPKIMFIDASLVTIPL